MIGTLRRITSPTQEILTPDGVKNYLRIDTDLDDSDLEGLIVSAREWIESVTGRNFGVSTYVQYMSGFNDIILPRSPYVDASVIVKYIDEAGNEQTLATNYTLNDQTDPAQLIFFSPPVGLNKDNPYPVSIQFQAGYTAQTAPAGGITAMKLWVSHFYNHRDLSDKRQDYSMDVTQKLSHLINPIRLRRFH